MACRVSFTSCTRITCAPWRKASSATAIEPGTRVGRRPGAPPMVPMKRLREAPKRMRAAESVQERRGRGSARGCGRRSCRSRSRDRRGCARAECPPPRRRRRAPRGSRRRRGGRRRRRARPAWSAGRPGRASGRPAARTRRRGRGWRDRGASAETSLKRSAPASKAARATAALRVSIEIGSGKPSARRAAITGHDARDLLGRRHRLGAGPGRTRRRCRGCRRRPSARPRAAASAAGSATWSAAVGEAVGGDVEDAHDPRAVEARRRRRARAAR